MCVLIFQTTGISCISFLTFLFRIECKVEKRWWRKISRKFVHRPTTATNKRLYEAREKVGKRKTWILSKNKFSSIIIIVVHRHHHFAEIKLIPFCRLCFWPYSLDSTTKKLKENNDDNKVFFSSMKKKLRVVSLCLSGSGGRSLTMDGL